jgi:hypothetical protein
LIESSEPARRVAEALRDLEASFLITSQKQQWLDGEREDWLETVRLVARVVDRPLMTFGLLRVIGSLLNDLAMSLKEGSFVARSSGGDLDQWYRDRRARRACARRAIL